MRTQANILRHLIREMLETDAPVFPSERLSNASVYRDIERGQDIFKFNGTRLTLRDPSTRPFAKIAPEEIEQVLTGMIEQAGYEVIGIVPPRGMDADAGPFSSKYNAFKVIPKGGRAGVSRHFYVVFGFRYSAAESIQFEAIKEGLLKAISVNGGNPIRVWNGTEFVEVDDADRIGGKGAKADVVLTRGGAPAVSISLKNLVRGKGSDMQQWSGVSAVMTHPEVTAFVERVKSGYRDGEGSNFWRRINDEELKMKAVWGPLGESVDVIVAGTMPHLEPTGDPGMYRIDVGIGKHGTGGVFYRTDGVIPGGELDPVFFARKEEAKSLGTLKGVRGMIAPIALATSRKAMEI
jgi:hypothetical protein